MGQELARSPLTKRPTGCVGKPPRNPSDHHADCGGPLPCTCDHTARDAPKPATRLTLTDDTSRGVLKKEEKHIGEWTRNSKEATRKRTRGIPSPHSPTPPLDIRTYQLVSQGFHRTEKTLPRTRFPDFSQRTNTTPPLTGNHPTLPFQGQKNYTIRSCIRARKSPKHAKKQFYYQIERNSISHTYNLITNTK